MIFWWNLDQYRSIEVIDQGSPEIIFHPVRIHFLAIQSCNPGNLTSIRRHRAHGIRAAMAACEPIWNWWRETETRMRHSGPGGRAHVAAAAILAMLMCQAAQAQTENPDLPPATPNAPAAAVAGDPIDSNLVDVSLGDWELKNKLASQLKVKVSQIPLTVAVTSDVASKVCPIGHDELDQQKVTSATRTCAAKQMTDELRETVRTQLRAVDGN